MGTELGKAKIEVKGGFTLPPLDIDAIRKRAESAPKEVKQDIERLIYEVSRKV